MAVVIGAEVIIDLGLALTGAGIAVVAARASRRIGQFTSRAIEVIAEIVQLLRRTGGRRRPDDRRRDDPEIGRDGRPVPPARPGLHNRGMDLPATSGNRAPLRLAYEEDVRSFDDLALNMRASGVSPEQVARELHEARRNLGVTYKKLTPPDKLREIYSRNSTKYGDPLGPSVDWLRSRGKTWEQIIESATRPGGKDLGL